MEGFQSTIVFWSLTRIYEKFSSERILYIMLFTYHSLCFFKSEEFLITLIHRHFRDNNQRCLTCPMPLRLLFLWLHCSSLKSLVLTAFMISSFQFFLEAWSFILCAYTRSVVLLLNIHEAFLPIPLVFGSPCFWCHDIPNDLLLPVFSCFSMSSSKLN